jgi:NAD(P)-dependent dehydrogenase (short-subunit alcohol dehydrogenase family)
MARLENTVVMITGGAQGIGEGIALRLASEGAAIAIADLNGDKAKAVAATLKGEGAAGAISVQVDVGDRG